MRYSKKLIMALLVFFITMTAYSEENMSVNLDSRTPLLDKKLEEGEAIIWYLGHAGWAVKTKKHFLIFDYTEEVRKTDELSLLTGYINPSEIKDQNVFVFVTHEHSDHFDNTIFEWKKFIKNITYIFGWQAIEEYRYKHICLVHPQEKRIIDDIKILTINHSFDGIPEVAFLIKLDALVIYHSGDHGSTGEELNPTFKDNIDYLSRNERGIDIAFISIFGNKSGGWLNKGDLYTIEQLLPKVTFPMHQGGSEQIYKWFFLEAETAKARTKVICAEKRGDRFFYQNGKIK